MPCPALPYSHGSVPNSRRRRKPSSPRSAFPSCSDNERLARKQQAHVRPPVAWSRARAKDKTTPCSIQSTKWSPWPPAPANPSPKSSYKPRWTTAARAAMPCLPVWPNGSRSCSARRRRASPSRLCQSAGSAGAARTSSGTGWTQVTEICQGQRTNKEHGGQNGRGP